MTQKRKQYSATEKVEILRKHLLENVLVSDLCEEYGLHPSIFYRWQKAFFENGAQAFNPVKDNQTNPLKAQITALEEKLARKNEVLGEVMEELVRLKKTSGAS